MKKLLLFFTTLALLLPIGSVICRASVPAPTGEWLHDNYSKREVYIPTRDGVRLHTAVYEPKDSLQHPVIMIRTPYGVGPYGEQLPGSLRSWMKMFTLNRYIIVFQSVRGTFLSEGTYENIRPLKQEHKDERCRGREGCVVSGILLHHGRTLWAYGHQGGFVSGAGNRLVAGR